MIRAITIEDAGHGFTKAGKPWIRMTIKAKEGFFSTFNPKMPLLQDIREGDSVMIRYEPGNIPNNFNLLKILQITHDTDSGKQAEDAKITPKVGAATPNGRPDPKMPQPLNDSKIDELLAKARATMQRQPWTTIKDIGEDSSLFATIFKAHLQAQEQEFSLQLSNMINGTKQARYRANADGPATKPQKEYIRSILAVKNRLSEGIAEDLKKLNKTIDQLTLEEARQILNRVNGK